MKGSFTDQTHILSASPRLPPLNKNPACEGLSTLLISVKTEGLFCLSFTTYSWPNLLLSLLIFL